LPRHFGQPQRFAMAWIDGDEMTVKRSGQIYTRLAGQDALGLRPLVVNLQGAPWVPSFLRKAIWRAFQRREVLPDLPSWPSRPIMELLR
jgi:hypothetical protein